MLEHNAMATFGRFLGGHLAVSVHDSQTKRSLYTVELRLHGGGPVFFLFGIIRGTFLTTNLELSAMPPHDLAQLFLLLLYS